MKKHLFWVIVAFALQTVSFAQISTIPPSYRIDEDSKPTKVYRAEKERINDLVHTKLDLKFDYKKQHVLGEAWITLKPHFYKTQTLELDAKSMDIHKLFLIDGLKRKKLKFSYDNTKLKIDLDKEYSRNQEYTIYIKYTAKPNEIKQKGSRAISEAKGLYFINPLGEDIDKPTQIWTQGETESSSCWFPTIDATNQKTSQEIYLTYPKKYSSLSNGLLLSSKENKDGTKTDYWKFDSKHAPYLFFVGIGDYAVIKDKWKDIEVSYYVEPEYKEYARAIFGDTPEMIQFFSDILNFPFPWEKYAQITARDYVSGAMENTTATLFNESVQQKPGQLIDENSAETIIAHELFHHWFGDLVTTENWSNLALNEAFANYSEYLWLEHKYGKERADNYLYDELSSYYLGLNFEKNLIRIHYDSREEMFDVVTYNKGGAILHMLRNFLGDEAFFEGLHKYLVDNQYGKAEVAQLRIALEEISGRDLNWFFNQWFFNNGHPKIDFSTNYDIEKKKLEVIVKQNKDKLFEFPYAIDIVNKGKVVRKEFWVAKQELNKIEFEINSKPDVVIPNANQILISELTDNKNTEAFIAQYKAGKGNFYARKSAIEALAKVQNTDVKALETLLEAVEDTYEGIRIEVIGSLDLNEISIVERATPILKKIALEDPKTTVRASALNALNYARIFDEKLLKNALESKSFRVQAAAIDGLLDLDKNYIKEISDTVDEEVIKLSSKLIMNYLPIWISENNIEKANLISDNVAMYIFVKFQDMEEGMQMEEGFRWIMSNDTPKVTKKIMQIYESYYTYFKNMNPMAGEGIRIMAELALELKQAAFENRQTDSLEKQVEMIKKALKKMN